MHLEALREKNRKLFVRLPQFPGFYLAGGTALALQIGHRVSVDFDLFSGHEIEKQLLSNMRRVFSDVPVVVSVNNPDELTTFINEVKITFLYYPFPVLCDFAVYDGVSLLSVKEISATKAYTIGRRGSYKDYVDLYYILSERHATLEEIIELAGKKYGSEFNGRLFLEQLVYLADIEDTEIQFLRGVPPDKVFLENFFANEIKKIKL